MTSEARSKEIQLDWGHKVFGPNGEPLQLPAKAVYALRRLGVLEKNRNLGGYQISAEIYELMRSEYDSLTAGLRPVLGEDISGPATVECNCNACRRKWEQLLKEFEGMLDFRADMAVQQSAR